MLKHSGSFENNLLWKMYNNLNNITNALSHTFICTMLYIVNETIKSMLKIPNRKINNYSIPKLTAFVFYFSTISVKNTSNDPFIHFFLEFVSFSIHPFTSTD